YRLAGENDRAVVYADEVIRSSTDLDGTLRKPMRIAEAEITLAVVAARQGDVERAVALGRRAISGERKSLPSLLMVSGELSRVLSADYSDVSTSADFLEELRALGTGSVDL
ncbi:XRE family transcriptional regulator, partial [Micromonospora fluostatini]